MGNRFTKAIIEIGNLNDKVDFWRALALATFLLLVAVTLLAIKNC